MNIGRQEFQAMLERIKSEETIPTLLLHSCCAPCSSYVIEYLSDVFKITVLYYNPNISPSEEYEKRASEQQRFIRNFNTKNKVDYIEGDYDSYSFEKLCEGMEGEAEGGERCRRCFELRLEKTAQTAKNMGFDYFTTTLSVSPYKNASTLNEIGARLSEKYNIKYLVSDFKKNDGYKRSIELSKKHNLYRQDYCGCKYSKKDADGNIKNK